MNPFFSARMVRRHVRAGLALFLLLVAGGAMAATPDLRLELQAGSSYTESTGTATVFVEGIFAERPIGASRFSWAPDVSVGWINGRHMPRYRHDRYTMADGDRSVGLLNERGMVAVVGMFDGGVAFECEGIDQRRIVPVVIGHRGFHEDMIAFAVRHRIHPVVDKVFSFDQLPNAYRALEAGQFFGKIGITYA